MSFRYDESDSQLLIVYTGDEHNIEDYREMVRRWVSRFEGDTKIGILMVNEPHEHPEDEDHEAETAALVQLINDFRRDHRHLSQVHTIGYANVYDPNEEWLISYKAKNENAWEELQAMTDMRTRYMYGTHGRNFTDIESAKVWLREQAALPPIELTEEANPDEAKTQRVGLFFGSTTGFTENLAYKIQSAWNQVGAGDLIPVNIGTLKDLKALLDYDYLILGIPTWNIGQLQDDWEIAMPLLEKLDFLGKKIALFGTGDQYTYSDNFLDAVGILGRKLRFRGAYLVGFWPTETYEFAASLAVENGRFMGLGIDEVHQANLTSQRIVDWLAQVIEEFALPVTA